MDGSGLFPSAAAVSRENVNKSKEDWLRNDTFDGESSKSLQISPHLARNTEQPVILSDNEGSDSSMEDADNDVVEISSSSDLAESPKNQFYLDASPNKNNLYFGRPYKVPVPKYYIDSDICVGLSNRTYVNLKSKKGKLRKKSSRKDRYYLNKNKNYTTIEIEDDAKVQIAALNKCTKEQPEDIENWFNLVDFQNCLFEKSQIRTIHERKISILDKAIGANPNHLDLKLKRIQLLCAISQDSKRDWDNLIFQHPLSLKCWLLYIESYMSSSNFAVNKCLKVYAKCLRTFNDLGASEHDKLVIIQKLIRFLMDCGRSEHALYLLIVLVEINVRSTSCDDLNLVKSFLENGDAILGEFKSQGFDSWHSRYLKGGWNNADGQMDPSESNFDDDDDIDVDLNKSLVDNWLTFEKIRSQKDIFPWRSNNECEDPERSVKVDDVVNFIVLFKLTNCRVMLFKMLIRLLGGDFPSISLTSDHDIIRGVDHPACYVPASPYQTYLKSLENFQPLKFSDFKTDSDASETGIKSPHHSTLKLIFEQMIVQCSVETQGIVGILCIQYYTHLLRNSIHTKKAFKPLYKEAKKFAKALIGLHQQNYHLWGVFAELEFYSKKLSECKKVFLSTLLSCKCPNSTLYLTELFSRLFFSSDANAVGLVLSSLVEPSVLSSPDTQPNSALTLRAGRKLLNMCEDSSRVYQQKCEVYNHQNSPFMNAISLYVIYNFLYHSIDDITQHLEDFLKYLRQPATGGFIQASVDMLSFHSIVLVCSKESKSVAYRRNILRALDDFPDHPKFLLMLCDLEVGSAVFSRARKHFISLTSESLAFFAVYFEIIHLVRAECALQGNPRVCNLLERVLSKNPRSILLWRIYALFSNNPHNVYTRALVACPWSKILMIDFICHDPTSLTDCLKLMMERNVRMRTPLEEVELLMQMNN